MQVFCTEAVIIIVASPIAFDYLAYCNAFESVFTAKYYNTNVILVKLPLGKIAFICIFSTFLRNP